MRCRITQDTVASLRAVFVGEVIDLSHEDAAMLLSLGKAVAYIDAPPDVDDCVVHTIAGLPAKKRHR